MPDTLAPVLKLQIGLGGLRPFEQPGATGSTIGPMIDVILADLADANARKDKRRLQAG